MAEDSFLWRETPIVCRVKCGAFFHAENTFFYTDCLVPEFEGKCVHMPQPWLVGLLLATAIAVPIVIIACLIQCCVNCYTCCCGTRYHRV
ncbi:hypothetical protein AAVH_18762 [Aphelenchoides avenae]|nr:hypothetical protein AAVH_18762 [Aphelenchus avenae]